MLLLTPTLGPPTNPPRPETTLVVHESAGGASSSSFDWSKLAAMAQQAAEGIHTWSSEVERLKTNLTEEKDKNECLKIMFVEVKDKYEHLKTMIAEEKDKYEHLKTMLADEKDKNERLKAMCNSSGPCPSFASTDAMPLLTPTSGPAVDAVGYAAVNKVCFDGVSPNCDDRDPASISTSEYIQPKVIIRGTDPKLNN
uniref:Uncharacterized protein n=1 Tax=Oryza glumipatula TaxID=40148 RepID=A0A0E0BQ49_9ORYZ